MAKNAGPNTSIPIDQPVGSSPGIVHRESAFFAQDGETDGSRGFVRAQLDSSSAVGKLNGNRSSAGTWMTPRPLTDGVPFTNLRGGN